MTIFNSYVKLPKGRKYGFRMIRRWSIRHELAIWISWSMLIWWPDSDLTGVGMMQWIFNVFQYQVVFIWFVSSMSIETWQWMIYPTILCWSFLMDQSSSCLVSCQVQDSSGQSYWWNKQTNQAKIDFAFVWIGLVQTSLDISCMQWSHRTLPAESSSSICNDPPCRFSSCGHCMASLKSLWQHRLGHSEQWRKQEMILVVVSCRFLGCHTYFLWNGIDQYDSIRFGLQKHITFCRALSSSSSRLWPSGPVACHNAIRQTNACRQSFVCITKINKVQTVLNIR